MLTVRRYPDFESFTGSHYPFKGSEVFNIRLRGESTPAPSILCPLPRHGIVCVSLAFDRRTTRTASGGGRIPEGIYQRIRAITPTKKSWSLLNDIHGLGVSRVYVRTSE